MSCHTLSPRRGTEPEAAAGYTEEEDAELIEEEDPAVSATWLGISCAPNVPPLLQECMHTQDVAQEKEGSV